MITDEELLRQLRKHVTTALNEHTDRRDGEYSHKADCLTWDMYNFLTQRCGVEVEITPLTKPL